MLILNLTYPLRCLRVPPVEYHWDRRLGGPQGRSGRGGGQKNSQPPPEIEPRIPIFQPIASCFSIPRLFRHHMCENFILFFLDLFLQVKYL